ncbi:MAG TPA: hypothetical protein VMZ50_02105 [Phycisphaerae bacterium]|nr:hypothetical protein [Phycisphaerae bacterium]
MSSYPPPDAPDRPAAIAAGTLAAGGYLDVGAWRIDLAGGGVRLSYRGEAVATIVAAGPGRAAYEVVTTGPCEFTAHPAPLAILGQGTNRREIPADEPADPAPADQAASLRRMVAETEQARFSAAGGRF